MPSVAVVEDIRAMSSILQKIIEEDGELHFVKSFDDYETALSGIMDSAIDIVLLDINLNGRNGIELIRELRQKGFKGQFLICTLFQDDTRIFESLKAGATGYILKRSSEAEIVQSIKELYNGGSPMSPEIARRVVTSFKQHESDTSVLSVREREILSSIADGMTYKSVAEKLFISPATVRNHLHNIYEKLQVKNKTEAINKFQNGN